MRMSARWELSAPPEADRQPEIHGKTVIEFEIHGETITLTAEAPWIYLILVLIS
jgi:hypothetical protein